MTESSVTALEGLVLDPITMEPMLDAVLAIPSGRTYSEAVIKTIIAKSNKDPFTNLPLSTSQLVPNFAVRQAAEEYVKRLKSGANDELLMKMKLDLLLGWKSDSEILLIDLDDSSFLLDPTRYHFSVHYIYVHV